MARGDAVFFEKPQHYLIIGGYAVVEVEAAVIIEEAPSDEEGRVGRMPASLKQALAVGLRPPCSDGFSRVALGYVLKVGVYRINTGLLEADDDGGNSVICGIEIARVQKSYDLAGGHLDPLVHSIIGAAVRFGHEFGDSVPISLQNVACAVRGAPVNNDIFDVLIVLAQYACDGLLKCPAAVQAYSYY